jgi:hypothetical protein
MGCCGEPIDKPTPEEGNRAMPFTTGGLVTQQPSAHSDPSQWQEKSLATSIATPQPVLQYGKPGEGIQQPWAQQADQFNPYHPSNSSSPPPGTFNMSSPTHTSFAGSPSPPPGSFAPSQNYGLAQPTAAYAQSQSVRMSVIKRDSSSPSTKQPFGTPVADEGKLSIAIDFG